MTHADLNRFESFTDGEWKALMEFLGLSLCYKTAVWETLREDRWKTAKNPKGYIRTVAQRIALKEVPAAKNEESNKGDLIANWSGFDDDREDCDEEGHWLTPLERLVRNIPKELQTNREHSPTVKATIEEFNSAQPESHIPIDPFSAPDWGEIAKTAKLDDGERFVLECKLNGLSLEKAIKQQDSDEAKKLVRAAWRRFDYGGVDKLRKVLQSAQ